jgi:putative ABC transport system ATP-binding protein
MTAMTTETAVIDIRGLTKTYGTGAAQVPALRGIDLQVRRGEIVLIEGPSGSGKTTLLLAMGAMLRPTEGTITVDGTDITAARERDLPRLRARHIGFIFQDFALLPALDALENVEVAANLAGITGRAARQRAETLLATVGLAHRSHHRPGELSGGERQRVAIARALANDPAVILADEPTANLDSHAGRSVAQLLRQLATDEHRAIVVVTHDLRLADIADRLYWLEDGQLSERDR